MHSTLKWFERRSETIAVLSKFKASLKAAVLAGNLNKEQQLNEISDVIDKINDSRPIICTVKGDLFGTNFSSLLLSSLGSIDKGQYFEGFNFLELDESMDAGKIDKRIMEHSIELPFGPNFPLISLCVTEHLKTAQAFRSIDCNFLDSLVQSLAKLQIPLGLSEARAGIGINGSLITLDSKYQPDYLVLGNGLTRSSADLGVVLIKDKGDSDFFEQAQAASFEEHPFVLSTVEDSLEKFSVSEDNSLFENYKNNLEEILTKYPQVLKRCNTYKNCWSFEFNDFWPQGQLNMFRTGDSNASLAFLYQSFLVYRHGIKARVNPGSLSLSFELNREMKSHDIERLLEAIKSILRLITESKLKDLVSHLMTDPSKYKNSEISAELQKNIAPIKSAEGLRKVVFLGHPLTFEHLFENMPELRCLEPEDFEKYWDFARKYNTYTVAHKQIISSKKAKKSSMNSGLYHWFQKIL